MEYYLPRRCPPASRQIGKACAPRIPAAPLPPGLAAHQSDRRLPLDRPGHSARSAQTVAVAIIVIRASRLSVYLCPFYLRTPVLHFPSMDRANSLSIQSCFVCGELGCLTGPRHNREWIVAISAIICVLQFSHRTNRDASTANLIVLFAFSMQVFERRWLYHAQKPWKKA